MATLTYQSTVIGNGNLRDLMNIHRVIVSQWPAVAGKLDIEEGFAGDKLLGQTREQRAQFAVDFITNKECAQAFNNHARLEA